MPKEYVRSSDYNFVAATGGSTEFPPDCRLGTVEIRWSKYPQSSVEIGSGDETLLRALIAEVGKAIDDAKSSNTVKDDATNAISGFFNNPAFWVSLDWDGCNQLMRKLRKARDDAWGKPE